MWRDIIILFSGIIVLIVNFSALFNHNRNWREISFFSLLLITGITLNILINEDVVIPNPSDWLIRFYQPFNHLLEKAFST